MQPIVWVGDGGELTRGLAGGMREPAVEQGECHGSLRDGHGSGGYTGVVPAVDLERGGIHGGKVH